MKTSTAFLIGFLLVFCTSFGTTQNRREVGNLVLENVPEIPDEIKSRIQQYQNTRSAYLADWIPGEDGILISTRFGNTSQLHLVKEPMGTRSQITFFDEPVNYGQFCPSKEHNGFLFLKDSGGDEFSQIFWFDMATRNTEMVSDGKSVNFGVLWSNAGEQFAFTSTRRNQKDFDIYVSDIESPQKATLKISEGSGYWMATDWSLNDKKLIVVQYLSSNQSNSFIYDLETDELKPIKKGVDEAVFLALAWDKSGEKIYAVTDIGKEFNTLVEYNVQKDTFEYITDQIPWDVEEFVMNKDKTQAAFTVNENGFRQLYLFDPVSGELNEVPNLPVGQVYALKFHPSEQELGMVLNTTKTPGDVYSLNLKTMDPVRWTKSEVGGLNTSTFPEPELFSYETFDEVGGKPRRIPAFAYKPDHVKGPMPVLIAIHGGPEGQAVPYFSSFFSFLSNELGIAVIEPNVRGSSGYGKTYLKLDNGMKRENSVKDIGALIEWVQKNPELDEDKISVYGGSYGGYMVLASMVHFGDQLKCGVDIVGISNFVTFLENTEEYRRDLRRVEYGDERDTEMREFLESISPTNHVDKINKPLFIIQGANDPRVPVTESEQMVESIRNNEGEVWYMLAKDEGHGFRKKENRDKMTEAIALFLKEFLLEDQ